MCDALSVHYLIYGKERVHNCICVHYGDMCTLHRNVHECSKLSTSVFVINYFFAPLIKSQQLLLQSSLLDTISVMNLMLTECVWNKNLR
jgi:hypothetical protein